jgi:hypothetical protein
MSPSQNQLCIYRTHSIPSPAHIPSQTCVCWVEVIRHIIYHRGTARTVGPLAWITLKSWTSGLLVKYYLVSCVTCITSTWVSKTTISNVQFPCFALQSSEWFRWLFGRCANSVPTDNRGGLSVCAHCRNPTFIPSTCGKHFISECFLSGPQEIEPGTFGLAAGKFDY